MKAAFAQWLHQLAADGVASAGQLEERSRAIVVARLGAPQAHWYARRKPLRTAGDAFGYYAYVQLERSCHRVALPTAALRRPELKLRLKIARAVGHALLADCDLILDGEVRGCSQTGEPVCSMVAAATPMPPPTAVDMLLLFLVLGPSPCAGSCGRLGARPGRCFGLAASTGNAGLECHDHDADVIP